MKDKDVPGFNHGGGKIKNYDGATTIAPVLLNIEVLVPQRDLIHMNGQ